MRNTRNECCTGQNDDPGPAFLRLERGRPACVATKDARSGADPGIAADPATGPNHRHAAGVLRAAALVVPLADAAPGHGLQPDRCLPPQWRTEPRCFGADPGDTG